MIQLILVSLFAFSFWWALQYSHVAQPLRERVLASRFAWVAKWYSCVYCIGFDWGLLIYLVTLHGILSSVFHAFIVAIICYGIMLAEKWIVTQIAK